MKKFCFVLVMILLLVGCSSTGTDKSKSQEEHRTITFDGGYEKIAEFKSMLEKDDKELEEYLIKNRYYANNIQTRIDVEAFFEMLNRTYFPVMEKANNTCVIIYPWDEAWIRYESSHGASYGLRVCINSDTAEEEIQSVRAEVKDRLSENINKNKAAEDIKINVKK